MQPSLLIGTKIMCLNDHHIATVNRDIFRGDTGYSSAFDFQPGQTANKGDPLPLTCHICGAPWFSNYKILRTQ